MRPQVILLVKDPGSGQVKSRLCRHVDPGLVSELYRNFVLDMLETLGRSGLDHAISFYPRTSVRNLQTWLGSPCDLHAQRGRDPAERLMHTFEDAFARGREEVVALASDVPDLTEEVVREAMGRLRDHDAVIGPSDDGGYYGLGFRKDAFTTAPFRGIAWSTPRAFADTMDRMAGLRVHRLPAWPDVDTFDDLRGLLRSTRNPSFSSSRTMAFLQSTELGGQK